MDLQRESGGAHTGEEERWRHGPRTDDDTAEQHSTWHPTPTTICGLWVSTATVRGRSESLAVPQQYASENAACRSGHGCHRHTYSCAHTRGCLLPVSYRS